MSDEFFPSKRRQFPDHFNHARPARQYLTLHDGPDMMVDYIERSIVECFNKDRATARQDALALKRTGAVTFGPFFQEEMETRQTLLEKDARRRGVSWALSYEKI